MELAEVIVNELTKHPKSEGLAWIGKYLKYQWEKMIGKSERINDWEMRRYSQNGEDGIIQYIFRKIGVTNRFFVEFGMEDGQECNSKYLREKAWRGLGMDGEHTNRWVKKETITSRNIERLLDKYKVPKQFDLLSIDIDSSDYWVWKTINKYRPRVVVIEYNSCMGKTACVTVPDRVIFRQDDSDYYGASLQAMVKLAKRKGYRLVGCESRGVNAFFVETDLADKYFPKRGVNELFRPPKFGLKQNGRWLGYRKSQKKMVRV